MEEKWKIFEINYEISNCGTIRNLKTKKVLKFKINRHGYYTTNISINGKLKTIFPHRLVAQAFIPNTENKPCVNHIDGNKLNNRVDNLEWCTNKENTNHAVKIGLIKSKAVLQLDLNNNFIKEYNSIKEVCEENNFKPNGIYLVCSGHKKTSQGYKWAYK